VIVLAGGDLVLADRLIPSASLVIDGTRIVAVAPGSGVDWRDATTIDVASCYVVPGFIDVHVHGVDGHDSMDEGEPVAEIASRLPRYGVTAFCPTTVACAPRVLRAVLAQVATERAAPRPDSARVLAAHLESNFINPEYRGAQPVECLRVPPSPVPTGEGGRRGGSAPRHPPYVTSPDSAPRRPGAVQVDVRRPGAAERTRQDLAGDFSASDILDVIAEAGRTVGIVTLAPELPGAIELIRALVAASHRVSLGHSGASLEEAMRAIDAGARHATHLFNRMTPMTHRAPGVAGAVLARDEVAVELICDGIHVHPDMCRIAIRSKGVGRVMAITDGTAGSGLSIGSTARLGGQRIRVTDQGVVLDDGTRAGSTLTMDRAFKTIVRSFGCSVVEAAVLCSTTPARELGLIDVGVLREGADADLTVLDRNFEVVRTFVGGREVYARDGATVRGCDGVTVR
jgi:N-acetylglucosamine-6-phosphate deacetylase